MKLPKTVKIEAVCSNDETRCVLMHPYLDIKDGAARIVATNGRALVAVPVTVEDGEESGWVSIPALTAARKAAPKRGEEKDMARVHCNGTCQTTTADFPRPFKGKDGYWFPNYRQAIPDAEHQGGMKLAFNAQLLADIVKAAGGTGIVRLFQPEDPEAPITIGIDGAPEGTIAVLMPCRV
jgi:DNA polymerase III sliding clamp (beta) subunit (PCNA family)